METGARRWVYAAVATVLAAGLGVGVLLAGVAIGHRYTTVRAAFTDKTRTVTRTHTETRTATVTSRPVVVVTHPNVIVKRPVRPERTVTRTVTQAPPVITVTETVTASSFSQ